MLVCCKGRYNTLRIASTVTIDGWVFFWTDAFKGIRVSIWMGFVTESIVTMANLDTVRCRVLERWRLHFLTLLWQNKATQTTEAMELTKWATIFRLWISVLADMWVLRLDWTYPKHQATDVVCWISQGVVRGWQLVSLWVTFFHGMLFDPYSKVQAVRLITRQRSSRQWSNQGLERVLHHLTCIGIVLGVCCVA